MIFKSEISAWRNDEILSNLAAISVSLFLSLYDPSESFLELPE